MATLSDIAKACGTSSATASYVLSGKGNDRRISFATQALIRRTAEEMGYHRILHPSPSGHPLIAVYWLQKHLQMTMPSLIDGINGALSSEISPVDVSIRPFEQDHIDSQESLWTHNSCNAAIIVAASAVDLTHLSQKPVKVPTVLLNRELTGYSSVSIDHDEAGRLAAVHAIRKGGGDLALILNPSLFGLHSRGNAIVQCCQEHGIDLRDRLFYCGNQIDDGYELGWRMIRENRLPKVIICIYDMVGLGILSALNEAGLSVGDEVQVISTSTGSSRLFARSTPPMTVVDLKMEELSEKAVKMAIGLATHQLEGPQKLVVHPSIVYRQSCPIDEAILSH